MLVRRATLLRLAELLDHMPVEGRDVGRLPTRNETLIYHNLAVDPVCTGILQVSFQRGPRCDGAPAYDVRLDKCPRPVADRRDRLALVKELAHECNCLGQCAQLVGIGDTARQQQRVKSLRIGLIKRYVQCKFVLFVEMLPCLYLPLGRRDDARFSTSFVKRLLGFNEFSLLETVGHQDRYLHSVEHRLLLASWELTN